jgi:superfamily II DNA/RNA helicase
VCGKAQTGSGKTLAFGLPLIERTAHADQKDPHGLVVVPTRELCVQVSEALRPLAASRRLTLAAVYGGAPMGAQMAQLRQGVDLLVATPGRLIDLIDRKAVDVTKVLSVVLDEADQMADMGFLPQVHQIMRRIGGKPQVMLFSATLDGQVQGLINRYLHDPVRREVAAVGDLVDTATHRFLAVHRMDKPKLTARIIRSVTRTLIFVSTRHGADRVAADLPMRAWNPPIHGDLRQSDRSTTGGLHRTAPALCANLAARGLDIPDVDVVLHYEPPQDYKDFVHRSDARPCPASRSCGALGRVGRGRRGAAAEGLRVDL